MSKKKKYLFTIEVPQPALPRDWRDGYSMYNLADNQDEKWKRAIKKAGGRLRIKDVQ